MMNDAYLWAEEDAPVADIEEWAILMALSKRADPDGCNAYSSYPTIAARAKIDPKTVYRRAKAMESRGILKRGDQSVVAHIRADNRPVVWDIQIPLSWFPNIDRINRWRKEHGKAPMTKDERPDLAPAPEKKRRADAGRSRGKKSAPNEGTSSPVAAGLAVQASDSGETDGTHGLQVRPDSESMRGGTSSPTTSLGVEVLTKGTARTSPPPTSSAIDAEPPAVGGEDPQERTRVSSEIENQEWKDRNFYPDLTAWEQSLHDECMAIRPDWSGRQLRKVLGSSAIRERTARNPELVRRAFLLGAKDRRRAGHVGTLPGRMPYDACPHWATAADALLAEQEAGASGEGLAESTSEQTSPAEPVTAAEPVDRRVPEQRLGSDPAPPAGPTPEYRAWQERHAARQAARAAERAAAEEERRRRLEETLTTAGVPAVAGVSG